LSVEKKRKAHSGKKVEQKLKGPSGSSAFIGAASKKLSKASLKKRSSDKKTGPTKTRNTRKAAANPRSYVFPSSKNKTSLVILGKVGSSDLPDFKI